MIEIDRDEDRVVLRRGFLDDPRLSFRAKGLLAVLLSRPDVVGVDLQTLAAASGERASAVEAALRQLEKAGYFTRAEPGASDASPLAGTVRETSALPQFDSISRRSATEPRRSGRAAKAGDEESLKTAAERILARLNELRQASWIWARYTPLSSKHAKRMGPIHARLREGYTEVDLIFVLEYLAAIDGGKDASRRYFDTVTTFNTQNFERNLAMARDWDARGRPPGTGLLAQQAAAGHDPAIYEKRLKGGKT